MGSRLCLIPLLTVLALAGFAGVAQAEESEWMIGVETLLDASLKEEKTSFAAGTTTLAVTSSGPGVQCKEMVGTGTIAPEGEEAMTLKLSGCEALKAPSCKVSEPVTLEATTELLEAGGKYYSEVKPKGVVKLSGEGCTKESVVAGSVAAEISMEPLVKRPLNFSKAITEAANKGLEEEKRTPLKLTYGGSAATLEGKPTATLSGANSGETWLQPAYTKLCKIQPAANRNDCGVSFYPLGTSLTLEKLVNMKFKFGIASPVCTTAKMNGATNVDAGAPLTGTLEAVFKNCNDGMSKCTIETLAQTYVFWFNSWGQAQGSFSVRNFGLELTCLGTTCKYREPSIGTLVLGGAPPLYSVPAITMAALPSQPVGCAANLSWEGPTIVQLVEFEFFPNIFYITGR